MTIALEAQSFASLQPIWNGILSQSNGGTTFSTWEFQTDWYEAFGGEATLHLYRISDNGSPLGIAPLMQQDGVVSFVGAQDVCDYLDFPILVGREPEVLSAVVDRLATLPWDRVELISLRATSPTLAILPGLAVERGWQAETVVQDTCPQLPLPASWEEYLSGLSKKDRHELRRKFRRLETASATCRLGTDREADIEAFLALHRQSDEDKAEFMNGQMESFFRRIAADFDRLGQYGMYLMDIDGQPVSAAMCFYTPGELLLYNSGFRRDYAHLSVGLLLKAFCIRDAIERRIPVFNFLRGDEPYKYHLGGQDEPVYNLVITRAEV